MPEIALRLCIYGKVQGVCYRDWMVKTANELGVDGWVRNRKDGWVEALALGEEAQLRELIRCCRDGPPRAHVERIIEEPAQGIAPHNAFIRKPTV